MMSLHKLLVRQIRKHLPEELWSDERLTRFVEAVNDSYSAFEKDKAIADHASRLNEEEYTRINDKLKTEVLGRWQAIKVLKEAIGRLDQPHDQAALSGQNDKGLNLRAAGPNQRETGLNPGETGLNPDEDSLNDTLNQLEAQLSRQWQIEAELIEAREQAEQFARSKDNFLANMSHEIRTPMNAVLGMAGQLAKTNLDDKQRFYLETIHSASENLLVILNDILDLTKIKAGKLGLEKIGFQPSGVIKRALQVMMHRAEERGLRLQIAFCDPLLSEVLIGDPYRLNQVLLNLLSNAIKFTSEGSVNLSCRVLEDKACLQKIIIEVADTGMGMDESFIQNLFDKFTQEYDSVTRRFGGTGLGMSICKELIELMGGEIHVFSKKGAGTTVSLVIPLEKGSEVDLSSRNSIPVNSDILKNKSILVVDDNDMNRLVAITILENYGAILFEAANGREAINFLRGEAVDIVLMDIQMPVMSGLEASQIIRSEISATLPLIALTANAIRGESDRCLAAGMNDYLSKPFEEGPFINMLSHWLAKQPKQPMQASDSVANPARANAQQPAGASTLPPPVEPSRPALYDFHRLEAVGQGNQDFIKKMIGLFIEQVPAAMRELQAAAATGDFQAVHGKAHQLKPIFHNFSIDSLYQEIRELESLALARVSSDRLDQLVATVANVVGEVVTSLKAHSLTH